MEFPTELVTGVVAFLAVAAAHALKGIIRMIGNYVRGTPNTIDDKIWAAVSESMHDVVNRAKREG